MRETRQLLQSSCLPRPLYNYSQMVKIGPMYQLAGMIAVDPSNNTLVSGGAEAEASFILAKVSASLPDFCLTLQNMLGVTIYTTRFADFPQINNAWEKFFAEQQVPPPARTSVGVSALPMQASVMMEFRFCHYD